MKNILHSNYLLLRDSRHKLHKELMRCLIHIKRYGASTNIVANIANNYQYPKTFTLNLKEQLIILT
jgi:hypothetical protein